MSQGLSATCNTGLCVPCGRYVAHLDDDDLYYSYHLETLVSAIEDRSHRVAFFDALSITQRLECDRLAATRRLEQLVELMPHDLKAALSLRAELNGNCQSESVTMPSTHAHLPECRFLCEIGVSVTDFIYEHRTPELRA